MNPIAYIAYLALGWAFIAMSRTYPHHSSTAIVFIVCANLIWGVILFQYVFDWLADRKRRNR